MRWRSVSYRLLPGAVAHQFQVRPPAFFTQLGVPVELRVGEARLEQPGGDAALVVAQRVLEARVDWELQARRRARGGRRSHDTHLRAAGRGRVGIPPQRAPGVRLDGLELARVDEQETPGIGRAEEPGVEGQRVLDLPFAPQD